MNYERAIRYLIVPLVLSSLIIAVLNFSGVLIFSTDISVNMTTVNTVLGVILGFGASTYLNIRQDNRRNRNLAINTRKALISELESMDQFFALLTGINYSHPQAGKIADTVSTTVYDSNLSNIGILFPEEVNRVVNFYSSLQRVRTLIRIAAKTNPDDTATGEVMGPDRRTASLLNAIWHSCIEELRENIPAEDRPPQRDLEVIEADDSMESTINDYEEVLEEFLGADIDIGSAIQDADETGQTSTTSPTDE